MKNRIEYESPELEITLVEEDILTFSFEEIETIPGVGGEGDND